VIFGVKIFSSSDGRDFLLHKIQRKSVVFRNASLLSLDVQSKIGVLGVDGRLSAEP